jgi:dsRNA-specific ribonuclease
MTLARDESFIALKRWLTHSDFSSSSSRFRNKYARDGIFHSASANTTNTRSFTDLNFSIWFADSFSLAQNSSQLVIADLCATVLSEVEILDLGLIQTAISTSVSRERDNYQKLDFLGDSVLKFLVLIFAASKYKLS